MKINWKIRIKNPVFWANLAAAIILPILTALGLNWTDMASWSALINVMSEAIKNPVIVVSIIVSIWNLIQDPTTEGLSDSKRALTYKKPGGSEDEC